MATAQRPPKNHFEDHTIGTFRNWLKEQPGVEPKTIDALVADGFTSLSIFACIKEEDIASLKPKKGDAPLNDPQKAVLEALVVKTQLEKEGKSSLEFKEWLRKERKLQKNTMNALLEKGFKTFESAVGLKDSDIDDLQVAGPQKKELKKLKQDVWEKMEDEAKNFKTWLKKKGVNTKTMNNLHRDKIKNLTIFADMAAPKCALYGDSRGQTSLLHSLGDMMSKIKKGADLCRAKENGGKGTRPGPRKRKPADNPQPSTSRQEETGVKRPKTSRGHAAVGDDEVTPMPALERLRKHYEQKRLQQQKSKGENQHFARKRKWALDVKQMKEFFESAPKSVGMVLWGSTPRGTGFRVGTEYIMTCWHVVTKDESSLDILSNLRIEFTEDKGTEPFNITQLMYGNKTLDVAILRIDGGGRQIPAPLRISRESELRPLHLLGHPEFASETLVVDSSVEEVRYLSKYELKALNDYYLDFQARRNSPENIFSELVDDMLNEDYVTFHTSFMHGASGSPGLVIENDEAKVRLMLCKGIPKYYHDLIVYGQALYPEEHEKFRFEQGLSMARLHVWMTGWMTECENPVEKASRQRLIVDIFN